MDSSDGAREDMALLLAIKDAEINTLRQQMAQLADDLKRNLAVLCVKDEEALKLRSTVDALRSVLAEKDNLFSQFQVQVQELEAMRLKETEQRTALEQLLAAKQLEWKQQQDVVQQDRDAELAALQQQLKESDDRWSAQLMQTRQTALDESVHRSTQQQAALERVTENGERLQQQVDCLTSALGTKQAELDAAHRQLGAALEATQKLEATHAKALVAKDNLIQQLQQQLEQQNAGIDHTTREHETNMNKLISSLQQMQESCQAQALEVQEYAAGQKKLQDERKVLREQLRQQEATITKLQTEKGVLEAALQHEVTAQATAQAQLNIFQAKLTEAVVELEKRCAAAETRSSRLMSQLVEERGRLVDAVIEQANSSTPQLAAELARSLESDRLRTQAELQLAQERSRSLQEDLSLIRSTLLPLLQAPAAAAAAAAGAGAPVQAGNGCMAALAQVMMQKEQQQQQRQEALGADAAGPVAGGTTAYVGDAVNKRYMLYASSPAAAAATGPCSSASPGEQQYCSPARGGNTASSMRAEYAMYGSSPAAAPVQQLAGAAAMDRTPLHGCGGAGGSLAGLVHELQSDVDKLQAQLQHSRRQLKWDSQQQGNSGSRGQGAEALESRPGSSGGQHHHSSGPDSPVQQQRQQHSSSMAHSDPQHPTPHRQSSSLPAGNGSPGRSPDLQLHDALRYLLERTERLSAENGALKTQLVQGSPTAQVSSQGHHSPHRNCRNNSSSPYNTNSTGTYEHKLCGSDHRYRRAAAVAAAAGAAAGADDGSDSGHGAHSERGQCDCNSSSSMAGSMHGNRDVRDDLSSAASEEPASASASAQAMAAVECYRHRRQARAAAAAAAASVQRGKRQQFDSPGQYGNRQAVMLQRSSSMESADTSNSTVVSELSSCETLSAVAAGGGLSSRDAKLLARIHQASTGTNAGNISSKQLLETMLAHWPANNKMGKLMKELVAAAGNGGLSSIGASDPRARGPGRLQGVKNHTSIRSSIGAAGPSKAALAREQLRRLAELSPTRQRLLRALAGPEL